MYFTANRHYSVSIMINASVRGPTRVASGRLMVCSLKGVLGK